MHGDVADTAIRLNVYGIAAPCNGDRIDQRQGARCKPLGRVSVETQVVPNVDEVFRSNARHAFQLDHAGDSSPVEVVCEISVGAVGLEKGTVLAVVRIQGGLRQEKE